MQKISIKQIFFNIETSKYIRVFVSLGNNHFWNQSTLAVKWSVCCGAIISMKTFGHHIMSYLDGDRLNSRFQLRCALKITVCCIHNIWCGKNRRTCRLPPPANRNILFSFQLYYQTHCYTTRHRSDLSTAMWYSTFPKNIFENLMVMGTWNWQRVVEVRLRIIRHGISYVCSMYFRTVSVFRIICSVYISILCLSII